MPATATKPLTAEEFFALPDDGRKLELVRGEVTVMSSPGLRHGEAQGNAYRLLKNYLIETKLGRVFVESGLVTERNLDTVRGPDVSYYSKERLPLDLQVVAYHNQPADLCVEVKSPSNTMRELRDKAKEYLFAGVRMVWIIDPEDRTVTIITDPLESRMLEADATLDGGDVLSGFSCKVADFFA